ncbi:MAG: hydrolase [Acidimicrobiales bacterium]|nr:MAG: hydrolase [Acidimicrobiales bacterium]
MTKVFVHGNPECDAVWGPLFAALGERGVDDLVALSPPGFGAPVPDGFDATPGAYVDWLVAELEAMDGPIDLVGHDWGAGHVMGLLARRPDVVRSWAADCAALIHPDYEWHDMAQAWQMPEVGEQVIEAMIGGAIEDRVATYVDMGLTAEIATAMAGATDAAMGECILTLYREAAQPFMVELGERVVAADRPPGMVVIASEDHFVPAPLAAEMAERLGAESVVLEGQAHWWMVSAPDAAADALADYWAGLG